MTQDPGGSDLLRRFTERRVRIQSALTEKEVAVANLRRGGGVDWMNYWNQKFHAANDALYRNRC
ncbi:hypothetical protein RSSE_c2902 [Ralstonia solanacearum]|nr:hypothetical protein RSSE_c2902 [Ralstonia solanacearum]